MAAPSPIPLRLQSRRQPPWASGTSRNHEASPKIWYISSAIVAPKRPARLRDTVWEESRLRNERSLGLYETSAIARMMTAKIMNSPTSSLSRGSTSILRSSFFIASSDLQNHRDDHRASL